MDNRAFSTDLAGHKATFTDQGFAIIPDALSSEFIDLLTKYSEQIKAGTLGEIQGRHMYGWKHQYRLEFPSDEFVRDFLQGIGDVTGVDPQELTISERHLYLYYDGAESFPPPHQDRHSSQFTVGFPIEISESSRVCLFPKLKRKENREETAFYLDVKDAAELEELYSSPDVLQVKGKLRDMHLFNGSKLFHGRTNPGGCIICYIKLNARGSDPLRENWTLGKAAALQ